MSSTMKRIPAILTALAAVLAMLPAGAFAEIDALCTGGSASVTVATDPTHVYLPQDGGTYPLGRLDEGDTKATGTLSCPSALPGLSMRLDVSLLLPGGPNYTSCFTVADGSLSILGVLAAPACATVNQALLGTLVKFPWRSTGATITASCANCTQVTPIRTFTKFPGTNNGNVTATIALAASTLAGNGVVLPSTAPVTNVLAPFVPPGIYHVEASFGPSSSNLTTGKRYGEWVVTGLGAPPIPVPGCDGTQATEAGCLTKATPTAPTAPDCIEDPNGGDPICPPPPPAGCIEDPNGGDPICPPSPSDCIEDPNGGDPICPPPPPAAGVPPCSNNPPLPGADRPSPVCIDATGRYCVTIPFIPGTTCARPPATPPLP